MSGYLERQAAAARQRMHGRAEVRGARAAALLRAGRGRRAAARLRAGGARAQRALDHAGQHLAQLAETTLEGR